MALLYGTQSNGETLPVLVDQFGNLLAKGIDGAQGPPGQPGQQGQQGIPGDPGAPGQGVPLPYGEDGSYLQIVNGAPEWTVGPDPGPGPEPVNIQWSNIATTANPVGQSGQTIVEPDPLQYFIGLDSWQKRDNFELAGSKQPVSTLTNAPKRFAFDTQDALGKVVLFWWTCQYTSTDGVVQQWNNTWNPFDGSIRLIGVEGPTTTTGSAGVQQDAGWTVGFSIDAATSSFVFGWELKAGDIEVENVRFRGFQMVDAGVVALRRQMDFEREVKALREVVMSSNQQSQT